MEVLPVLGNKFDRFKIGLQKQKTVVYLRQMDRELDAVLVLPFITIMAVMIAIFCRLKAFLSVRDKRPKSTLFEREDAVRRGF